VTMGVMRGIDIWTTPRKRDMMILDQVREEGMMTDMMMIEPEGMMTNVMMIEPKGMMTNVMMVELGVEANTAICLESFSADGDVLQHLSHRKLDKSSIAREKLNLCTRPCEEGRYTLLNVLEDARSCFLLGVWSISFVSCVSRTF